MRNPVTIATIGGGLINCLVTLAILVWLHAQHIVTADTVALGCLIAAGCGSIAGALQAMNRSHAIGGSGQPMVAASEQASSTRGASSGHRDHPDRAIVITPIGSGSERRDAASSNCASAGQWLVLRRRSTTLSITGCGPMLADDASAVATSMRPSPSKSPVVMPQGAGRTAKCRAGARCPAPSPRRKLTSLLWLLATARSR